MTVRWSVLKRTDKMASLTMVMLVKATSVVVTRGGVAEKVPPAKTGHNHGTIAKTSKHPLNRSVTTVVKKVILPGIAVRSRLSVLGLTSDINRLTVTAALTGRVATAAGIDRTVARETPHVTTAASKVICRAIVASHDRPIMHRQGRITERVMGKAIILANMQLNRKEA